MNDQLGNHAMDIVAGGVAVATIANWLPAIAGLFTIIWTGIRIWESETVKKLRRRWL